MKRYRKRLSLLLGLVLLVQGVAASAAPYAMLFAASAKDAVAADAGMPCHGASQGPAAGKETRQQAGKNASAQDGNGTCCDADCPDMGSCMLNHLVIASAFELDMLPATGGEPSRASAAFTIHTSSSLFRPPISLHA